MTRDRHPHAKAQRRHFVMGVTVFVALLTAACSTSPKTEEPRADAGSPVEGGGSGASDAGKDPTTGADAGGDDGPDGGAGGAEDGGGTGNSPDAGPMDPSDGGIDEDGGEVDAGPPPEPCFLPAGEALPESEQIEGDCRLKTCDETGHVREVPLDDPPASKACAEVRCVWGRVRERLAARGTVCASGVCFDGACIPSFCEDGIRDGSETDIDCGGSCPACNDNQWCARPADCKSGVCVGGRCGQPRCDDGLMNGDESDVDCGGTACKPCSFGGLCAVDPDCEVGNCIDDRCGLPACHQKEQATAASGGACAQACGGCFPGSACSADADCFGLLACIGGTCRADPEKTVVTTSVRATGLARDPVSGTVYVATSSLDARYPSRILAYRSNATAPEWSVALDGAPSALAVSADGAVLYAATAAVAPGIARVDLATRLAQPTFALGTTTRGEVLRADRLAVVPGNNNAVAVLGQPKGLAYTFGVRIYENGQPKFPASADAPWISPAPPVRDVTAFAFDGPNRLYGFNGALTTYEFVQMQLGADGLEITRVQREGLDGEDGHDTQIHMVQGRLFASSGEVLDPTIPRLLGKFPVAGPMAVTDDASRAYIVVKPASTPSNSFPDDRAYALYCLDPATFTISGSFWVDPDLAPAQTSGEPEQLVRWGESGLALRTREPENLFLMPDVLARVPGCAPRSTSPTPLVSPKAPDLSDQTGSVQTYFLHASGHRVVSNEEVYLSLFGDDGRLPNRVVSLRTSGGVAWSTYVGSEPGPLDMSTDRSVLWVGLTGAQSIVPVDLQTRVRGAVASLGYSDRGVNQLRSLRAVPEAAGAVAIVSRNMSAAQGNNLSIFDWGLPRPNASAVIASSEIAEIFFTSATHMFVAGPIGVQSINLSGGAPILAWNAPRLFEGGPTLPRFVGTRFIDGSGAVLDADPSRVRIDKDAVHLLGTTGAKTSYGRSVSAPSRDGRIVYLAKVEDPSDAAPGAQFSVHCYDTQTFTKTGQVNGTIAVPLRRGGAPKAIEPFGEDGLLFVLDDLVALAPNLFKGVAGCASGSSAPRPKRPDGFDWGTRGDGVMALEVNANALLATPDGNKLYVSVGSTDPRYANAVMAIATKPFGDAWAAHAASEPADMDFIDNGKTMVVTSYGAGALTPFALANRRTGQPLWFPAADVGGRVSTTRVAARGSDGLVAVVGILGSDPNNSGYGPVQCVTYAQDRWTPKGILDSFVDDVAFSGPDRVLSLGPGRLSMWNLDASGAPTPGPFVLPAASSVETLHAAGSAVLLRSGELFDATTLSKRGTLQVPLPSPFESATWLLSRDGTRAVSVTRPLNSALTFHCFDVATTQLLSEARFDLPEGIRVSNAPDVKEMARWAHDGIAVRTNKHLIVIPKALESLPGCLE